MPLMPPRHRPLGWRPLVKRREPFYGGSEWRAVRAFVLARDGGVCQRCGLPGANTVHHKIERKDGGSDDASNLEAVHARCHGRLHPEKGGKHD